MKPEGFNPIVIVIIISVLALAAAGTALYFNAKKSEETKTNVNAVANNNTNTNASTNEALNVNTAINSNLNTNAAVNANSNTNTAVDATTGWKTYTSSKYNYSIKYPNNWSASNWINDEQIQILPPDVTAGTASGTAKALHIDYLTNSERFDGLQQKNEVVVNGLTATQGIDLGIVGFKSTFFKRGSTYVNVYWDGAFTETTYSQILNTITFLDDTAGWKTYTSTKFGFTFKHPSSWKETDYTVLTDVPGSGDGVTFTDPAGKLGSFTWMQKGFIPYQDGQWDATTTSIMVGDKAATQITYSPKAGQQWAAGEPLSRRKIKITASPTSWGSDASMGLVQGKDKSWTTVETILSTFQFTN